jgi:hypothetical protein
MWNSRIVAVIIALASAMYAEPPLTLIQDVLYRADGKRFSGTITVKWTSFEASDRSNILEHSTTVPIVNGNLRVQLVPTLGAVPARFYSVKYNSDGKIQFEEMWAVPSSSFPLRVRDVRVSQPSSPLPDVLQETDMVGLTADLAARPVKGAGYAPSRAAVINGDGALEAVSGNTEDCVHVDGTASPCLANSGVRFDASSQRVELHGTSGDPTAYVDTNSKEFALLGTGGGSVRMASGNCRPGEIGTVTLCADASDTASFVAGTTKFAIPGLAGHIGGSQSNPQVVGFSLSGNDGNLNDRALTVSYLNDTTRGTSAKLLARMNTSGKAAKASTSDTTVPVFIVTAGAGTTGSAQLARDGQATCTFDAPASISQYVVASTVTDGQCHATTVPDAGVWVVGQLLSTVSGAGSDGAVAISPWFTGSASAGGLGDPGPGVVYSDGTGGTSVATGEQLPVHAANHRHGGGDEIATASAAPNAIPKADAGGKLDPDWLPTLKTTTFAPVSRVSTDGAGDSINGCPGGICAETAFTQTYTIPASTILAGKRHRITALFSGNSVVATPSFTLRLKANSTTIYSSVGNSIYVGNANNQGSGMVWMMTGTAASAPAAAVYTQSLGTVFGNSGASSYRNTTVQPVNLATNADITLSITLQWANSTAGNSITLQDLIVEALN